MRLPKHIRSRAKRPQKSPGKMNGIELTYAHILKLRKLAGEVLHYDYEPERLRLADNTYYVPDFRVLLSDGTIEFHECKAVTVAGKLLCEDDARVKFKVASETHWMYGWRMVGLRKGNVVFEEALNCEVVWRASDDSIPLLRSTMDDYRRIESDANERS